MAPKSCIECKKVERKKVNAINCHNCKKSFHKECRPMFSIQKRLKTSLATVYICKVCIDLDHDHSAAEKTMHLKEDSMPLLASTPAHPVAVKKAPTDRQQKALDKPIGKAILVHMDGLSSMKKNTSMTCNEVKNSNTSALQNNGKEKEEEKDGQKKRKQPSMTSAQPLSLAPVDPRGRKNDAERSIDKAPTLLPCSRQT